MKRYINRNIKPIILSVVGTRPEAIKMLPLINEGATRSWRQEVVLTSQHEGLSCHFAAIPTHRLPLKFIEQSAGEMCEAMREALCDYINIRQPDLVLVQGDTTSALAAALAANDCGIGIGHVEAGLRSGNLNEPWPEEGNRIEIDRLSRLLFAPSEKAASNLIIDKQIKGEIYVTGNTGIDALFSAQKLQLCQKPVNSLRTIVVSCHRRENRAALPSIAAALRRIADERRLSITVLLHPNPNLSAVVRDLLCNHPLINLIPPLAYEDMVNLIYCSWLILTDSGGLQEEGPAIGKPVLIIRNVTERPEVIHTGNAQLIGTNANSIYEAVAALDDNPLQYKRMCHPSFPYGRGNASLRICDAIDEYFAIKRRSDSSPILPQIA